MARRYRYFISTFALALSKSRACEKRMPAKYDNNNSNRKSDIDIFWFGKNGGRLPKPGAIFLSRHVNRILIMINMLCT